MILSSTIGSVNSFTVRLGRAIAQNKTMNQHPFNNSNSDESNGLGDISNSTPPTNQEVEPTTSQSTDLKAAKKSVKRFTLILIAIGVSLGAILAIATITFLNRLNFFDVPTQVDEDSR
ncbi:hypothetical protein ACE1B6_16635 [Aerosakkonemataceae cyanobacterium BLCC-F154]|uniref:Uncharacterized protein n=1 Tax=Floridaenema fluviatile BLCC-F154 TaxID=3153640 RepID=A0ABV4YEC9_9CYAN